MTPRMWLHHWLLRFCARLELVLGLIVLAAILSSGCNRNSVSPTAFQSASAQNKSAWDAATAAINSKDYLGALTNLDKLQAQTDLSADQQKAVAAAEANIRDQMYTAANKGDTAAQQALDELRKAREH